MSFFDVFKRGWRLLKRKPTPEYLSTLNRQKQLPSAGGPYRTLAVPEKKIPFRELPHNRKIEKLAATEKRLLESSEKAKTNLKKARALQAAVAAAKRHNEELRKKIEAEERMRSFNRR